MSFNSKHRLTKVRIAVFGDRQVGKTAFAVRYLTKRFIGEYDSNKEMVYTHKTLIDKDDVTIEMLDCASQNEDTLKEHITWADGYILIFSVINKDSLLYAQKVHSLITELTGPQTPKINGKSCPCSGGCSSNNQGKHITFQEPESIDNTRSNSAIPLVLVGNKTDLLFSRMVSEAECCEVANDMDCPLYELSVSENLDLVNEVLEEVIRQVKREEVKAREEAADKSMLGTVKRVLKKKIYRSKSDTV